MRNHLFYAIILLLWPLTGHAQIQKLTGVVFDRANQYPVPDVHVYLDGSSLYDVTDAEGRFEIAVPSVVDLPLVISHVSYHTNIISNPFASLPDTIIVVEEKENLLGEITVRAGRYTRKQLMTAFRNEFLGSTSGGRSCIIENEPMIDLWYDSEKNILSANCDEPILIHNRYLGYKIYLRLNKFEVEYPNRRLGVGLPVVLFVYSAYFEDLVPSNKRIADRRASIFEGSFRHFLLSLANSQLDEFDYSLYTNENRFHLLAADCFTVTDTMDVKKVVVAPRLWAGNRASYEGQPYYGRLNVNNRNDPTELIFFRNTFFINNLGCLTQPEDVLFKGYMGGLRIGDMLPADYGF